jgi:hypothetical protein
VPARESAPLSGWVVPYVLFCLVLALVGAFVLFSQARVLGHF